jgi:hypothetical protein
VRHPDEPIRIWSATPEFDKVALARLRKRTSAIFRTLQVPTKDLGANPCQFEAIEENAMTDFTAYAPLAIRRHRLPRLTFPSLHFGSSIESFAQSIRRAVAMAYVDPFKAARRQPETYVDVDLEGRDPNW